VCDEHTSVVHEVQVLDGFFNLFNRRLSTHIQRVSISHKKIEDRGWSAPLPARRGLRSAEVRLRMPLLDPVLAQRSCRSVPTENNHWPSDENSSRSTLRFRPKSLRRSLRSSTDHTHIWVDHDPHVAQLRIAELCHCKQQQTPLQCDL